MDQQLSPIKIQEEEEQVSIHVEDQQPTYEIEAKNTGIRSILKKMTSFPLAGAELSKKKSSIKKQRSYAEFVADQASPVDEGSK